MLSFALAYAFWNLFSYYLAKYFLLATYTHANFKATSLLSILSWGEYTLFLLETSSGRNAVPHVLGCLPFSLVSSNSMR